ncbi:outer membrane beta-barrel protein [Thalassotalea sp. LPB0316]|uniref:outer membrane beta-barrel protein n=1 Tax=Thalassotalea sp. LPB0316 TaxID=2769490 RepID=UPI001866E329|nr:outer membrane beta-barrel protein [Thalassotalea sp. LPB0316]QOL26155.1 outer membrane beta-barrel protein [Thalassotalea sp. LPB0316]
MKYKSIAFAIVALSWKSMAAAPSHDIDFYNLNFEYIEGNVMDVDFALEYGHLSNFTLDSDNDDTQTVSLQPKLWVQALWEKSLLQAKVDINHLALTDIDNNDHTNINALTKYQYKLSENKSLFLTGMYRNVFEYPGEGISQGKIDEITVGDEKSNYFANVGFRYGSEFSVARAEILVGTRGFEYDTRREVSSLLDLTANYLQGHFDYLASGKTYLSVKGEYEQLNYNEEVGADRDSLAILLGAQWRHSVLFKMEAYAGIQQLSFDDKNLDDDKVARWELDMLWSPTEFTEVNVNARRRAVDATQQEDRFRIVENLLATVTHDFTSQLKASFYLGYMQEQAIFPTFTRSDDYLLAGGKISYNVNETFSVYIKDSFRELSSTEESLDFDRNHIVVGINVAL